MATVQSKELKTATKTLYTDAHCYFEGMKNYRGNPHPSECGYWDKTELEDYTDEEIALIRKTLDAEGVVKPGEKYLHLRVIGRKREGDDWSGLATFDYPEGIYEICVEHELFES